MGAHHSQSLEAWLAHVPGLKVIMPSNPADGKGLLKAAVRDDNPVIYIEHRGLYWSRGPVPDGDHVVPLGTASIIQAGDDVTIVALGKMVGLSLEAAEELSHEGISVEVIDARSLSPLDVKTISGSVEKTTRLVVVHEAVEQGGIGAEIAARIQREAFYCLDSPIVRLGGGFAPIPASPALEKLFVPGKEAIINSVRAAMKP